MNKKNKHVDTTNKKQKIKTIVIPLFIFIVIIAIIVATCVSCAGRGNNQNIKPLTTTVNVSDYVSKDEYLRIDADDFALYVGDMVKLTCSSYPETYSLGVNWKSSDTSVLTVTHDGMVTAMKKGIAAITATNGVLSSSIIIEVIEENESASDDFPVYDPETPGGTVSTNETTTAGAEVTQESSREETTSKEPETTAKQEETSTIEEPTSTEPETTQPPTQEVTEPSETESATEPTEEEGTTIDARELILYTLPEFGFTNYINDTFVYKEDGNYLGQAIVEVEFTQIYVMTRTTGFDNSIKEFLKVYFPTGYATVFNKFISVTSDTTFYADGYKVRVITSPSGGHRQLIIYY